MVVELGFRDGMTPPSDLPAGEFVCTSLFGDDGRQAAIRIDHADPCVLITVELLDAVADDPGTGISLDCMPLPTAIGYTGALLKIHGVNRTVVYRITGYVPSVHAYIGEWPD